MKENNNNIEQLDVTEEQTTPVEVTPVENQESPTVEVTPVEEPVLEKVETVEDDKNPFEETFVSEKGAVAEEMNEAAEKLKSEDINTPKTKKKGKKGVIIAIICLLLLLGLGVAGYLFYYSNPKRLISASINDVSAKLDKTIKGSDIDLGEQSTISNDITFDIEADKEALKDVDEETNKVLNNLKKLKSNITIIKDASKDQMLSTVKIDLDKDNLLSGKYLIDGEKEYYYLDGLSSKYIENEDKLGLKVREDDNEVFEDLKYLNKFVTKSFVSHLDNKYFTKEMATTKINDKNKKVLKTTLKIDNDAAHKIINAVIKDIQNDSRATKILKDNDINAKELTVKDDVKLLDKGLEYNSYVDYISMKEYKSELIIEDAKLSYEKGKISTLELYSDDKLQGKLKITNNKENRDIVIYDGNSKEIGTVAIANGKRKKSLIADIDYMGTKMSFSIESNIKEIAKDTQYFVDTKVIADIKQDKQQLFKITSDIKSTMENTAEIKETVKDAIKSKDLKEEDQNKFMEKLNNSMMKLTK
ncbi:MAG: hypothetical protein IJH18_03260 [Bacilli bacterium]|nr:hypothetical protein [Bacilli bacterium]